jgi:hypothetical protein
VAGPWSPWLRDWSDILRLSFLVAAFVMLAQGSGGNALRLGLTFLVSLIPRVVGAPWPFDLAFGAGMSLQAWGNVSRIFYTWAPYHDIVHFTLTGATAILIYFVLGFLRLVPDLSQETRIRQRAGVAALTFALGSMINAVYEQYEWFADRILGGHLLENYHHAMFDLFFGGLGSIAAGGAMALWATRRWGMRRPAGSDVLDGWRGRLERRMERSGRRAGQGGRPPWRSRRAIGRRLAEATDSLGWRLLLGDWSRPVRDINDLGRLSMVAGLIAAVIEWRGDPVVRFSLTLVASLAVRWLNPPRVFEFLFSGGLLLQAWGAFSGALYTLPGYDEWTNFAFSLGATPILYLVLIRANVFPEFEEEAGVHRRVALFVAAMCLGFCAGIYYEEYVWLANHNLGATIPVGWNTLIRRLALDWAGSIAGGAALLAWDVYGWGTRQRVGVARARGRASYPRRAWTSSPSSTT